MEMSKLLSAVNSLLPHNDQFDIWNAMLRLEQLNVGSGAGAFRYDLSGHECIGRFKHFLCSCNPISQGEYFVCLMPMMCLRCT